jgi:hypothetical protein
MKAQLSSPWERRRAQPFTERGVRRLSCIRCAEPAEFQWQICSDGNNYRPLCASCDVDLNRLVLEWMGHPQADDLACRYAEQKLAQRAPSPPTDRLEK